MNAIPETLNRDDLAALVMKSDLATPHKILIRTLLYQVSDQDTERMIDLCLGIAKLIVNGQAEQARVALISAGLPEALASFIIRKGQEALQKESA